MKCSLYICSCREGRKLAVEETEKLKKYLNDKNIQFTEFEDFCGTASKESENLDFSENSIVIGCQPRAMENLIKNSGYDISEKNIEFIHINEILNDKRELNIETYDNANEEIKYNLSWKPWFPVLDYEKCTNCKQCMDFCLFGVYELDDSGLINVSNPEKCKDLCPACSRVCPAQAIIFPKHDGSPIDGGPGEFEVDARFADMDSKDVYKILLARRKRLKAHLLKKNQLKLAKEERNKCSDGKAPDFEFNIIDSNDISQTDCSDINSCACECTKDDSDKKKISNSENPEKDN